LTRRTGRFLPDTNIVIALLEGDATVLSNLDRASEVFIPAVVLGELFFGAAKLGRPSENTAKVERFAAGRAVVSCDLDVAREYGRLKQRLKEKGRPLPENDIWIAAAAKHHGMVLVTGIGISTNWTICKLPNGKFSPDRCRKPVRPASRLRKKGIPGPLPHGVPLGPASASACKRTSAFLSRARKQAVEGPFPQPARQPHRRSVRRGLCRAVPIRGLNRPIMVPAQIQMVNYELATFWRKSPFPPHWH